MTPEQLSDEHRLIAQTAAEFIDNEVMPNKERLEQKDWALNRELVGQVRRRSACSAPTFPKSTAASISTRSRRSSCRSSFRAYSSFGATFGAQANLTILPIYMFGTEAQKQKYLPGLVSGPEVGAYCLSESGSGSDSLGAKTRAMRQADGSFVMSGEKMWITNGGFADVYVIFAKVDGEHFTAFIVERAWPGVSQRQGRAQDGSVRLVDHAGDPAGREGAGGRRARRDREGPQGRVQRAEFRPLQAGRDVLGRRAGGDRRGHEIRVDAQAVRHRRSPTFGAIKHKLGEMTARQYRARKHDVSHCRADRRAWSSTLGGSGQAEPMLQALEEFAVEASIAKVLGSEVIDYILDENVQIHGGNGYVRDYPAEGHYRDARVNRIFEGTNEINRLLIPGMLMKKALKGELPLIAAAKQLQDEIMSPSLSMPDDDGRGAGRREPGRGGVQEGRPDAGRHRDAAIRREAPGRAGSAHLPRRHSDRHLRQRERAAARPRAADERCPTADLQADAARVYMHEAAGRIELAARSCLAAMAEGDVLRTQLAALRRLAEGDAGQHRRCCAADWRMRPSPKAGICSLDAPDGASAWRLELKQSVASGFDAFANASVRS